MRQPIGPNEEKRMNKEGLDHRPILLKTNRVNEPESQNFKRSLNILLCFSVKSMDKEKIPLRKL